MFLQTICSQTYWRNAPALRLVWKDPKGFLISTKFRGSSRHFRFDQFYIVEWTELTHSSEQGLVVCQCSAWHFCPLADSCSPCLPLQGGQTGRGGSLMGKANVWCYILGGSGFCLPECGHDLGTALLAGEFNSHFKDSSHPTSGTLYDLSGNSTSLPRSSVSGEIYFSNN